MKFDEFGFEPPLLEGLEAMGFEKPTEVQEKSIPDILAGRDVMACAQTGTGKTAAFLLPIINDLVKTPAEGVNALIIVPTRELALQIDQQLEGFSYFTPVSAMAIYGGRGGREMEQEKRAIKEGAEILIATPGRLKSHMEMGYANLKTIKFLVLDEADRMLDMGFAPDIMQIVNKLPRERQTLLFSATMPEQIRKFARQILREPVEINQAISKPAENIMQAAYEVDDSGKVQLTRHLLEGKENLERVIIFAGSKLKVRELTRSLQQAGMKAKAVSSDLEQDEREERIRLFRSGNIPIIVATDVLSRGLDIKGIDLVINYDVPGDGEDYVHRIGRTARADASGIALTFINAKDRRRFQRIEELIETQIRRIPLPEELASFTPRKGGRGGGRSSSGRGGPQKGRGRSKGSSRRGSKGGRKK